MHADKPLPPRSIADHQSLIAEGIRRGETKLREAEERERAEKEDFEREVAEYEAGLARRGRVAMHRCDIEARVEKLEEIFLWASSACSSRWKNPLFGIKVVQCDAERAHRHHIPSNLPMSMLVILRLRPANEDAESAARLLVARLIGEYSESPVGGSCGVVEWNVYYSAAGRKDPFYRKGSHRFDVPLEWKGDWDAIAKERCPS